MRVRAVITLSSLLLAACTAPNNVMVTRSDESPSATLATIPVTTSAPSSPAPPSTEPGERPLEHAPTTPNDPTSLLLTEQDLPDWVHIGPRHDQQNPVSVAVDCKPVNTAWGAVGSAASRAWGGLGTVRFRNTVVLYPDPRAASTILAAVGRVPTECPSFSELPDVEWWSEPLEVPRGGSHSVGMLLGNATLTGSAIGVWQAGSAIVILEVSGADMWQQVDPLFVVMAARVDRVMFASPDVETPNSNRPVIAAPPSTLSVPRVTVEPELAPDDVLPEMFPPPTADWLDDPLARFAPDPAELGDGWRYTRGSVSEAEPADPDAVLGDCGIGTPATPAGISLSYDREAGDESAEFEIELGQGDRAVNAALLATFRAIAGCDLGEDQFFDELEIATDATIADASDSVVLFARSEDDTPYGATYVIAAATFGDVVIFVFHVTSNVKDTTAVIDDTVALIELVAAKR